MSRNDSEEKLSPLLLKNKARQNDISLELSRIKKIFNERMASLDEIILLVENKNSEIEILKKDALARSFLSGEAKSIKRFDRMKKKLSEELRVLHERKQEFQMLLDTAQSRMDDLKNDLETAFNSSRAVEKLKEIRTTVSAVIDSVHEDYAIEDVYNFKRKKEE